MSTGLMLTLASKTTGQFLRLFHKVGERVDSDAQLFWRAIALEKLGFNSKLTTRYCSLLRPK